MDVWLQQTRIVLRTAYWFIQIFNLRIDKKIVQWNQSIIAEPPKDQSIITDSPKDQSIITEPPKDQILHLGKTSVWFIQVKSTKISHIGTYV